MPIFVVVSGIPGSGKSTLSAALARELAIRHLDKDVFLERLFASEQVESLEHRRKLSRLADTHFKQQALGGSFAVLSSWWRHPLSADDSGTPIDWLLERGVELLEVHCQCPAAVALERFFERRRHRGHLDVHRSAVDLVRQLSAAELLGPLFPARAVMYNTAGPASSEKFAALAQRIRGLLTEAGSSNKA